jgi:hypothetical protein
MWEVHLLKQLDKHVWFPHRSRLAVINTSAKIEAAVITTNKPLAKRNALLTNRGARKCILGKLKLFLCLSFMRSLLWQNVEKFHPL